MNCSCCQGLIVGHFLDFAGAYGQMGGRWGIEVSVPSTFSGKPRSNSGRRSLGAHGYTMIELMLVVTILGILASVAIVSYNHFVIKTQAVEGEIVVREVERLEQVYHASKQVYANSLADLGFVMTGTVKNYTPEVRMGFATDKIFYQVRAVPSQASGTDAWLLTRYRDGSVQMDRIPVGDLVAFATARYLGNAPSMTAIQSTKVSLGSGMSDGSGMSGSNEPEWSDSGSRLQGCKECGAVVINQLNERS